MNENKVSAADEYIKIIKENFIRYKSLGDKTFVQLSDSELHYSPDEETNSVSVIIQHMAGNLKSRFTDFLTSDGEKPGRNRDSEFVDQKLSRGQLLSIWEEAWQILFVVLDSLQADDLLKKVFVRNEEQSVMKALERQLTHHAYHVGQIVMMGKLIKKENWKTLTIPRKK